MRIQFVSLPQTIGRLPRLLLWLILAAAPSVSRLNAAFIGPYAPGNFSLTNTDADGFFEFKPDGSLLITGGNTGSGLPGSTALTVSSVGNGLVSFNFSYQTQDDALLEVAGYMAGSNFTPLADRNGISGFFSFAVTDTQTFGFRIDTLDNQGEPGYLTISNFSAPLGNTVSSVPEPSTWLTAVAGLAMVALASRGHFSRFVAPKV